MLEQADVVHIHRVRISAAGARHSAERMRQAVERAEWPQTSDGSWLFVRRVEASASLAGLPRALSQATRRVLEENRGRDVVRFATFGDLLAALLLDIAHGEAQHRWYWQRWSRVLSLSTAQALTSLMSEHLDYLASVCACLARRQGLARVWDSLSVESAARLSAELARRGNFALPDAGVIATELSRALAGGADSARPSIGIPSSVRQRWVSVLRTLRPDDSRAVLAWLLIGQEAAPLPLSRAPLTTLVQLARLFQPAIDAQRIADPRAPADGSLERPVEAVESHTGATRSSAADAPASPRVQEGRAIVPASAPSDPQSRAPLVPDVGGQGSASPEHGGESPEAAGAEAVALGSARSARRDERATPRLALRVAETGPDAGVECFDTRQGGLLYLLNFLNRGEALALLTEHWQELPNGWAWLYRLGRELELDDSDPIVSYIAKQMGLAAPAELLDLAPLPRREALLRLAQRWYGSTHVWDPSLLELGARVLTSATHVDLHASLRAVRLPVRLAGLDVNPGWLPWLGRVVTFHYD